MDFLELLCNTYQAFILLFQVNYQMRLVTGRFSSDMKDGAVRPLQLGQ